MSSSDVRPEKMPTGKVVKSSWNGSDLLENMWKNVRYALLGQRYHTGYTAVDVDVLGLYS